MKKDKALKSSEFFLIAMLKLKLAFIISFFALASLAQTQPTMIPELVIQDDVSTGPSRIVITSEQIQKSQKLKVTEILKDLAGLEVVSSGGLGQNSSIFIRGSKSEHTLVLVDGVEISDPSTTTRYSDVSQLSPYQIERIEILKGPQSIRYGSDAVGGVIHIITKKGEGAANSHYGFEYGSFNTLAGFLDRSGSNGNLSYMTSVSGFSSEGFSSAKAGRGAEKDSSRQQSFHTRLGYQVSDKTQLDWTLRYLKNEIDLDYSGGASGDDPNYKGEGSQVLSGLTLQTELLSQIESSFGAYYNHANRDYDNNPDPVHTDDYREKFNSHNLKLETWHKIPVPSSGQLEVGLQMKEEQGGSRQNLNGVETDLSRKYQSSFGQTVMYSQQNLRSGFDVGIRHDSISPSGESVWNSSLGGSYSLIGGEWTHDEAAAVLKGQDPAMRTSVKDQSNSMQTAVASEKNLAMRTAVLRGSVGTGYKIPSLYQLYSQFGSKDLKSEKVLSGDVSLENRWNDYLQTSVGYFENHYRELIDYETSLMKYQNISKANSKGWELQAFLDPRENVRLKLGTTFLKTRDQQTNQSLLRRADQSYFLEASWTRGLSQWSAQYRWFGKRHDIDPQTFGRIKLKSYDVLNLMYSYSFTQTTQGYIKVQNLFDKNYEEVAGYSTSRAACSLGVTGSF